MTPVLVDAGPIVAALDRAEAHHERCCEWLVSSTTVLVTCEAVIAEACFLVRNLPGAAAAILRDVRLGRYLLPFRLFERSREVSLLMEKYRDQPMSLADACLTDMATELGSGRILTLDSDFRVYRWGRNRPFELVLDI